MSILRMRILCHFHTLLPVALDKKLFWKKQLNTINVSLKQVYALIIKLICILLKWKYVQDKNVIYVIEIKQSKLKCDMTEKICFLCLFTRVTVTWNIPSNCKIKVMSWNPSGNNSIGRAKSSILVFIMALNGCCWIPGYKQAGLYFKTLDKHLKWCHPGNSRQDNFVLPVKIPADCTDR